MATKNVSDLYVQKAPISALAKRADELNIHGVSVLPRRNTRNFPDVTQAHYVMGKTFEGIFAPKIDYTNDFPSVTQGHLNFAKYSGVLNLEDEPNVVDLGCGIGFLGAYLGKKFNLQRLIYSDISSDSLVFSLKTLNLNYNNEFKTHEDDIEFRHGDASKTLTDLDGGVAVCAPYLIPRVCTVFPGVYDVFAKVAKNQGMSLYVSHSNLSQELVNDAVEKNNMNLEVVAKTKDLPLFMEYGSEAYPYQVAQVKAKKLFQKNVILLRGLGLKGSDGKYAHNILVSKIF